MNHPQTDQSAAGTRTRRVTRTGVVTSSVRNKTIAVTVSYLVQHAKYGKSLKRDTVLHAHDEKNECRVGDKVEIAECRPMSKTKHWRLVRVLQKAPSQVGGEL